MEPSEIWRENGRSSMKMIMSFSIISAGLAIIIAITHSEYVDINRRILGYVLSTLLIITGSWILLFSKEQVITVEKEARRIVVDYKNYFGMSSKVISFDNIANVSVRASGEGESGLISYHVVVYLIDGKKVNLFHGLFGASHDKKTMEHYAGQITRYLNKYGQTLETTKKR